MSPRVTPLLLVGLLVACGPSSDEQANAGAQPAANPAEAAIDQLRSSYVELYNQHDAAGVADLYTDSALVLAADQSVRQGRPAVLAALEQEAAGSPTVSLAATHTMVFDDNAVEIGEYTNQFGGDQPITLAGNYLSFLQQVNGQWKIAGLITNLSSEPPAGFALDTTSITPPADDGAMQALVDGYTKAFDSSDWAALASEYTSDATVAFSMAPLVMGQDSIRQRFEERFGQTANPSIVIHDVDTMPMANEYSLDGGWYVVKATTPDGAITQTGSYINLLQRQPDESWKIMWGVTNGYPRPDTGM